MNFYSAKNGNDHTISGRLIPLAEAVLLSVAKAANQPLPEQKYSKTPPPWTHNLCDQLTIILIFIPRALLRGVLCARRQIVNAAGHAAFADAESPSSIPFPESRNVCKRPALHPGKAREK